MLRAGEQRQMVEQRPHRGVEPIAVTQLECEAFGQIAGKDAGGIELLKAG